MVVLMKIFQVILALSILIVAHEFGHFTFAKLFGIRVEKFYLFFDIGGRRLLHFRIGETEYGIGWLPLGGYCKIAGMVDESLDLESLRKEPQPWEFRTHPAWQRLLVMAGGVLFNFIFAIIGFCCLLGFWGQAYVPNEGAQIYVNELAYEMGFRNGDRILSMDDYVPESFVELQADLARRKVHYTRLLRGDDTVDLYIDQAMIGEVLNSPLMFDLAIPFVIDSLMSGGPNEGSGLRHGDRIISIDGTPVEFLQDARTLLSQKAGLGCISRVVRGADSLDVPLQVDTAGHIGIYTAAPNIVTRKYGFPEVVPEGFRMTFSQIGGYLRDLRLVATPSTGAYKSVGSFIAIGQVFPSAWDWRQFIFLLSLLSIMLGVMNLIPIPGLDGGHILITLYEMVTGRKPSERFLAATQIIGMILLLALMLLAFGNDITRIIK